MKLFPAIVGTIFFYPLMASITAGICVRLWKGTKWRIEKEISEYETPNDFCMALAASFWPLTWLWWSIEWPCIGLYKLISWQYSKQKQQTPTKDISMYRDLSAAHARIEQLELEKADLQRQLDRAVKGNWLARLLFGRRVVDRSTAGPSLTAAIQPLIDAGIVAGCYEGRGDEMQGDDEVSVRKRLEWYAGQLLSMVKENKLFAVNSWLNCVEKFTRIPYLEIARPKIAPTTIYLPPVDKQYAHAIAVSDAIKASIKSGER